MKKFLIGTLAALSLLLPSSVGAQVTIGPISQPSTITPGTGGSANIKMFEITPSAPTAAQVVTGTGNSTNGTHVFCVTYITPEGETACSSSSAALTIDGTHKQGTITIPISYGFATARNVYASAAGTTTPLFLISTSPMVNNNTATTYTYNTADGSFTATTAPVASTSLNTLAFFTQRQLSDGYVHPTSTGTGGAIMGVNGPVAGDFVGFTHFNFGANILYKNTRQELEIFGYNSTSSAYAAILTILTTATGSEIQIRDHDDAYGLRINNSTGSIGTISMEAPSGTDQAGKDIRYDAGPGTGSGTPGVVHIRTSTAGGSSSTEQAMTDRITISGTVITDTLPRTHTVAGLATTSTDGYVLQNTTAATSLATVQISPRVRLSGHAWNSSGGGTDETLNMIEELLPATVAGNTTSTLNWSFANSAVSSGAYTNRMSLTSTGNLTTTKFIGQQFVISGTGAALIFSGTPTLSSGFGTGSARVAGTAAAFTWGVGTGGSGSGVITMGNTATTGWICDVKDITNAASFVTEQTASSTTTATFTNYSRTLGTATNWTDSDVLQIACRAY